MRIQCKFKIKLEIELIIIIAITLNSAFLAEKEVIMMGHHTPKTHHKIYFPLSVSSNTLSKRTEIQNKKSHFID